MANIEAAVVDDGSKSKWSAWRTLEWKIHRFMSLPQSNREPVVCPTLKCHGMSWKMEVYPRGLNKKSKDYVSFKVTPDPGLIVCLTGQDQSDTLYNYKLWIKGDSGRFCLIDAPRPLQVHSFFRRVKAVKRELLDHWGYPDESPSIYLKGKTMVLQLELQITESNRKLPACTFGRDMSKLLKSGWSADATFLIDGATFPTHRNVLKFRAPTLLELCEDAAPDSQVPIDGVTAPIFSALLNYIYTNEEPAAEFLTKNACELLDAADRFGCSSLKLLVESEIVRSGINADNVTSLLILADAKNCALLKEVTMHCIMSDPSAAKESEDWEKVKESNDLLVEIMEATSWKRKKPTSPNINGMEYDAMNVSTLRRMLDDVGLSGDGTREMLVKRLKEFHLDTDSTDESSAQN